MIVIGWRFDRAEARSRECVDLSKMKILAEVGAEKSEKLFHRKGKGSLAMSISQGLVDPNHVQKLNKGKGKQVNIPVLFEYARQRKSCF